MSDREQVRRWRGAWNGWSGGLGGGGGGRRKGKGADEGSRKKKKADLRWISVMFVQNMYEAMSSTPNRTTQ